MTVRDVEDLAASVAATAINERTKRESSRMSQIRAAAMELSHMNLVGATPDEMRDHIFACHDCFRDMVDSIDFMKFSD